MNDIPDWAGKRACELLNDEAGDEDWVWPADSRTNSVRALAKLVMQHEQPPVDPDEEAVKRILAAYDKLPSELLHHPEDCLARAVSQYKQEKANG